MKTITQTSSRCLTITCMKRSLENRMKSIKRKMNLSDRIPAIKVFKAIIKMDCFIWSLKFINLQIHNNIDSYYLFTHREIKLTCFEL